MALVAYSDESSEDEIIQKPTIKAKRRISAFNRNKSFGIQLSMREKTMEQLYSKKGASNDELIDDEVIDAPNPNTKIGSKRAYDSPATNLDQLKPKSKLLNKLMSKKALPSELKKLNDEEKKAALENMHAVNLEAEIDLEESIAKASAADRIFSKLEAAKIDKEEGKIDTDKLFIRSEYSAPKVGYGKVTDGGQSSKNSKGKFLGADKQSYTNRLQLSKGAVNVVQDDIAKNQKKAELAYAKVLEKYMKKEEDKTKMPEVADITGIRDIQSSSRGSLLTKGKVQEEEDIGGFFASTKNPKLSAGEVIGTLEEMGLDIQQQANNPKLPNPFAGLDNEDPDYIPDEVMGYKDIKGDAYTIYNLPYDPKTEKMNKRKTQEQHMLGNQQLDMEKVYRLSGNRKIQGEKLNMVEIDNKAQLSDRGAIQKHLAVYNEMAVSAHKADRLAEENEISGTSKRKNQVTHLLNEAIRNKERLEYMWASSKEATRQSKGKYGWGFGYIA